MEFVQGNLLPFCLSTWGGDKKTRKSLKNWIQITVQWLLSSEALGRTGNWVSTLPRITHSILPVLWGEGNETIPTQVVSSKAMHTQELLWFLAKTSVCFPSFSPFIFKAFHVSYLSVCYGLNGGPLPKCLCWRPNPQCLRMWPYVEKRSLKEGIKLKWGDQVRPSSSNTTGIFVRREKDTDVQREDHGETQREDCHPQAKERGCRRNQLCWHLGRLAPRIVRIKSCWLSHPVCGTLVWQRGNLIHLLSQ